MPGNENSTATEMAADQMARGRTRPRRILHVLDHSLPVLSGYSVRSHGLIDAQRQLGLAPHIVTGPLHHLDDHTAADGVLCDLPCARTKISGPIARRAILGGWPVAREAAVVSLLRNRIAQLLRSQPFDLVHAHSPALCGLAALRAARSAGVPVVYEIRAFWEDAAVDQGKTNPRALRYRAARQLENYVVGKANAVVGIAQHILKDLRARGVDGDKLFYVPNGVDASRFSPQERDEKLAHQLGIQDEVVFGFIGSLYRYEGIPWLVGAMAGLRKQGLRCRLLVIGDGEDASAIAAAVREHSAGNYVQALGRIAHDQVRRYYSVVDVMVYPRRSVRLTELVTPLKPLEAMAQGKAVLGSRVGGILELAEHEDTALLFAPENLEEFAVQARRLIEQPGLRRELGDRARRKALEEKDWKVVAKRYFAAYEHACQKAALNRQPQVRS